MKKTEETKFTPIFGNKLQRIIKKYIVKFCTQLNRKIWYKIRQKIIRIHEEIEKYSDSNLYLNAHRNSYDIRHKFDLKPFNPL